MHGPRTPASHNIIILFRSDPAGRRLIFLFLFRGGVRSYLHALLLTRQSTLSHTRAVLAVSVVVVVSGYYRGTGYLTTGYVL